MRPIRNVLIALIVLCSAAPAEERSVILTQNWQQGQIRRYVIVMEKAPRDPTQSLLEIKVAAVRGKGHELLWTYLDGRYLDGRPLNRPTEALFKLIKKIPLRLVTDEDGSFTEIANKEESETLTGEIIENIVLQYPADERAALRTGMKQLLQSGAMKSAREPQNFLAAYGVAFQPGRAVTAETEVELLNGVIPARITLEVTEAGTGKHKATIRVVAEGEKATRAFEEQMREALKKFGKPLPEGRLVDAMRYKEECAYTFLQGAGWPERVECSRDNTIKMKNEERTQHESIRFLPESSWNVRP